MRIFQEFAKLSRFAKFALFAVAYNVFIIVWGAFVRASKSGDGCGSHYPLCNGEVVPLNPTAATIIEFFHRLTSGADGIIVLILLIWAFRAFPKKHAVRLTAVFSFLLILLEAAIGAFLVKFELVAGNVSMNRAIVMSFHLISTLILLLFLTLTAWFAVAPEDAKGFRIRGRERKALSLTFGLFLVVVVGMSGAISALGNTLFPGRELSEAFIQKDVSPLLKIFVWLQIWHPFLSVLTGIYLIALTQPLLRSTRNSETIRRFAAAVLILLGSQLIFGTLNLIFLAPVWMQLFHLLLADLLWIALCLLSASVLCESSAAAAAQSAARKLAVKPV
jgi:heme A synthase